MSDLYASEDGLVARLSPGEVLFQNKYTASTHVMTLQVLGALDQCRAFKSMDDHVAWVTQNVQGLAGQTDAVRHVLNAMAERKLMVPYAEALADVNKPVGVDPVPLAGLFVRTCDRADQLAHLLSTVPVGAPRVIVLDDSRQPESLERNAHLVKEARDRGLDAYHVDVDLRAAIGEALVAEAQVPAEAVGWLLHDREDAARFSGGRVYNLALLMGAGQRIAMVDDDFRFQPRTFGDASSTLEMRAVQPFVQFFETYGAAQSAGQEAGWDAVTDSLDYCGQTVGDLLTTGRLEAAPASDWNGHMLAAFREFRADTRVISVLPATYGDDRSGNTDWLYTLDEGGRRSLWADSHETYQRNLEHRNVVYSMRRPTLRAMANFTPLVLDGSRMLPPAAPVYRGEDLYQSALTKFCHPNSMCLEVPVALGHWRDGKRRLLPPAARTPSLARFIADAVLGQSPACEAADPAVRLQYATTILRDLAGATRSRRSERLTHYLTSVRADTVNQLNQTLEQTGQAPNYWANDVRSRVEANALVLTNAGVPKLADWTTEATAEACADRLQSDLNDHVRGLDVWASLWSQCSGRLEEWLALTR